MNENSFTPPWFLSITATGNTFSPQIEHFIPRIDMSKLRTNVMFPSCLIGNTVYQNIKIYNEGDTPILFNFKRNLIEFSAYPLCGLILKHEYALIELSFTPSEEQLYISQWKCVINETESSSINFMLSGQGCVAKLEPSDNSMIFIKPTALGLSSTQEYTLHNKSRIPIIYSLKLPDSLEQVISLDHSENVILPNDRATLKINFSPKEIKNYESLLECDYSNLYYDEKYLKKERIVINATGKQGALIFEPKILDLGSEVIGNLKKHKIELINTSDCSLNFNLLIKDMSTPNSLNDDQIFSLFPADKLEASLYPKPSGTILARSKLTFDILFQPKVQKDYEYKIVWKIYNEKNEIICYSMEELEEYSCKIKATGTFPKMTIDDIRSRSIATHRLWKEFNCFGINELLNSPLEYQDIVNNNSYGLTDQIKEFKVTFDPAPVGSDDCIVFVKFHNNGNIPISFQLIFPNESGIEMENWVEPSELSGKEREIKQLMDKNLFGITPNKNLKLKPDESITIQFRYSYLSLEYNGLHNLIILLKIDNGKQIKLLLSGTTLNTLEPKLHIDSKNWTLNPVPLGTPQPYCQSFYLYNPSNIDLYYNIDQDVISNFNDKNYNFPVLRLSEYKGKIPHNGSTALLLYFRPLEEKQYDLILPVIWNTTEESNSFDQIMDININGRGYLPDNRPKYSDSHNKWNLSPTRCTISDLSFSIILPSMDQLRIGLVPKNSLIKRIIVLENPFNDDLAEFAFNKSSTIIPPELITIEPDSGVILPNETVICEISLHCNHSLGYFEQIILLECKRLFQTPPIPPCLPDTRIPVAENMTENFINRQNSLIKESTIRSEKLTKKYSEMKKDIINVRISC